MAPPPPLTVGRALREHWPEYFMEAWGLGAFMVSAGVFATLLEYSGSPVRAAITSDEFRLVLLAIIMGATAVGVICSPWGKRSGAHINPAVTLTFLRLGKIKVIDAGFYILAQFAGGTVGVLLVWAVLGAAFAEPPVSFVNTVPGQGGPVPAFVAEVSMSCGLMLMIVVSLARPRLTPLIGPFAGLMIATYIALFAPLSGMSINPARTFASAAPAGTWGLLWLYFTAPVLGMLSSVEIYRLTALGHERFCAKLNHDSAYRCIHCGHEPAHSAQQGDTELRNPGPRSRRAGEGE